MNSIEWKISYKIGSDLIDRQHELMQSIGYPDFEEHRRMHIELKENVEEMMLNWKSGKPLNKIAVTETIKQWLTVHIPQEDRKIGVFIQQQELIATHC